MLTDVFTRVTRKHLNIKVKRCVYVLNCGVHVFIYFEQVTCNKRMEEQQLRGLMTPE